MATNTANPFVREVETFLAGQSQAERKARDANINRAIVSFGLVPDFTGFTDVPTIDQTTRQLAQQATESGVSTIARMRHDLEQAQRLIPNQLAARGMLDSGDTPYALGEAQRGFNLASFDATRQLLDYISGAWAAYAQSEQGRQFQILQARQEARLRDEEIARQERYRAQDLAMQQAANAAAMAGGGGGGYYDPGYAEPPPAAPGGGGVLGYSAEQVAQMMDLVRSVPTARKRDERAAADPAFAAALHVFRYINGGGT